MKSNEEGQVSTKRHPLAKDFGEKPPSKISKTEDSGEESASELSEDAKKKMKVDNKGVESKEQKHRIEDKKVKGQQTSNKPSSPKKKVSSAETVQKDVKPEVSPSSSAVKDGQPVAVEDGSAASFQEAFMKHMLHSGGEYGMQLEERVKLRRMMQQQDTKTGKKPFLDEAGLPDDKFQLMDGGRELKLESFVMKQEGEVDSKLCVPAVSADVGMVMPAASAGLKRPGATGVEEAVLPCKKECLRAASSAERPLSPFHRQILEMQANCSGPKQQGSSSAGLPEWSPMDNPVVAQPIPTLKMQPPSVKSPEANPATLGRPPDPHIQPHRRKETIREKLEMIEKQREAARRSQPPQVPIVSQSTDRAAGLLASSASKLSPSRSSQPVSPTAVAATTSLQAVLTSPAVQQFIASHLQTGPQQIPVQPTSQPIMSALSSDAPRVTSASSLSVSNTPSSQEQPKNGVGVAGTSLPPQPLTLAMETVRPCPAAFLTPVSPQAVASPLTLANCLAAAPPMVSPSLVAATLPSGPLLQPTAQTLDTLTPTQTTLLSATSCGTNSTLVQTTPLGPSDLTPSSPINSIQEDLKFHGQTIYLLTSSDGPDVVGPASAMGLSAVAGTTAMEAAVLENMVPDVITLTPVEIKPQACNTQEPLVKTEEQSDLKVEEAGQQATEVQQQGAETTKQGQVAETCLPSSVVVTEPHTMISVTQPPVDSPELGMQEVCVKSEPEEVGAEEVVLPKLEVVSDEEAGGDAADMGMVSMDMPDSLWHHNYAGNAKKMVSLLYYPFF